MRGVGIVGKAVCVGVVRYEARNPTASHGARVYGAIIRRPRPMPRPSAPVGRAVVASDRLPAGAGVNRVGDACMGSAPKGAPWPSICIHRHRRIHPHGRGDRRFGRRNRPESAATHPDCIQCIQMYSAPICIQIRPLSPTPARVSENVFSVFSVFRPPCFLLFSSF